ncbi:HD domain-containing phosphohydrolase [Rugamonas sp.]|uniref:HD-GYP domain-containing protein n=1 Tax=Rugamonas sp. TaxID=1926287 RepID=UPI0025E13397|nr:HD domain-containing phosphohydrolase [Rugamonas sp.]
MPAMSVPPAVAGAGLEESPYYLQAVAALARSRAVVAQDDIYSSQGMKLASKGVQVGPALLERLAQHKLTAPLDELLASERPINSTTLALEACKIIEHDRIYARMVNRSGDPLAVKHALEALAIPRKLLLRLTVMREQRRAIFDHSLRTGIIAYTLAQCLGLPAAERDKLLIGALCHDVGEMHTDPALLERGHAITPQERRYIHVHPLSSYVLLRGTEGFPAAAALAVLHHHERLDGSGYPHGLRCEAISSLGKLIAVADVAETVIRRFDLPRLDMLARLHHGRFDHAAVDALRDLIRATEKDALGTPQELVSGAQLQHLSQLLQGWLPLRSLLIAQIAPLAPEQSPLAFLFERMSTIRQLIVRAGFDPDHVGGMLDIARGDSAIMLELRSMLDEMEWLLLDLAHEIDRHAPDLGSLPARPLSHLLQLLRPAWSGRCDDGAAFI